MMKKFEHKIAILTPTDTGSPEAARGSIASGLLEYEKDGWELVSASPTYVRLEIRAFSCFFRRELPD